MIRLIKKFVYRDKKKTTCPVCHKFTFFHDHRGYTFYGSIPYGSVECASCKQQWSAEQFTHKPVPDEIDVIALSNSLFYWPEPYEWLTWVTIAVFGAVIFIVNFLLFL